MWTKFFPNPSRALYDRDAARELQLYIMSDSHFNPYGQGMGRSVADNLRKKMQKGAYNPTQAPKAWEYVVAAAAKAYVQEFGGGMWYETFNATTRRTVAEQMADEFEIEERIRGNLKQNPRGRMTKADALRDFRENIKPAVVARYGRNDRIALREAWSAYVDGLEKDRMITRQQADNWDNPF